MCCLTAEDDDNDEEEDGAEPPWQDALLDVQLALLSRPAEVLPSAPLRDAVEALFRATCHVLTRTGSSLSCCAVGPWQRSFTPCAACLHAPTDGCTIWENTEAAARTTSPSSTPNVIV
jgi:hypothetical protein